MPVTQPLAVKKLTLDTHNFRTLVQTDELSAIHALIAIEPEWFWALMDSLIDDGYLPTENIIILEQGKKHIVKEGNRRIAALKIIHGFVPTADFSPPIHIAEKITALPVGWKKANTEVPCTVYAGSEEAAADKVVTLTHGKGEKAGRVRWSAVARARHNRDKSGVSEPALDLLEKFLAKGKNVTTNQSERWAGEYPLSVLDEAIKRLAGRLGAKSAPDVAKSYPKITNRPGLEDLLFDIGLKDVGFKEVRADDFGTKYSMPPPPKPTAPTAPGTGAAGGTGSSGGSRPTGPGAPPRGAGGAAPPPTTTPAAGSPPPTKSTTARPIGDPRTVAAVLKKFKPKGSGRSKLATLLEEVRKLDIDETPHAFCFVLRSMFEVSAKAYCDDHAGGGGPKSTQNGYDRKLVEMLKDIVKHLTANNTDTTKVRMLHGAITELANPESVLSVTSMNQLVHNPSYSVSPSNICIVFGNVFPLLEAMNK